MTFQPFDDAVIVDSGVRSDETKQWLNYFGFGFLFIESFWIALGLEPVVLVCGAGLAGTGFGFLLVANMPAFFRRPRGLIALPTGRY